MGEIENDYQLEITHERLKGAYKALDVYGTVSNPDPNCIDSILFTIINLQQEMIEYLTHKVAQLEKAITESAEEMGIKPELKKPPTNR